MFDTLWSLKTDEGSRYGHPPLAYHRQGTGREGTTSAAIISPLAPIPSDGDGQRSTMPPLNNWIIALSLGLEDHIPTLGSWPMENPVAGPPQC